MGNSHCQQNINTKPLKKLIESYELIINNDTKFPIHLSNPGMSIIDLALTRSNLDSLQVWEILEKYPSISD